jgi:cell division septation protein DedD
MPSATSEDTEITLGTGKMLALFFGLVALCAVFFAVGFSLGKETALKPSAAEAMPAPAPSTTATLHPTALRNPASVPAPADASDKPPDNQPTAESTPTPDTNTPAPPTTVPVSSPSSPPVPPVLNGYYVQVAAVTKQEDADALVDALKTKQYPAFSANAPSDKLFHVQCGPYGDIKDAEALRAKLISDGYNPILKK